MDLGCFDSKLVRLKDRIRDPAGEVSDRFDSKLVRLKEVVRHAKKFGWLGFDSKLVRLKGKSEISLASLSPSFDSKLVRLKDGNRRNGFSIKSVSIPNWFD